MKTLMPTVAFLGPEGTFAHLIAQKRFEDQARLSAQPTIPDVFEAVARNRASLGIVPIENSSGGTIYETVDQLVNEKNNLIVQESLSLNVRLALIGRDKTEIRTVFSHPAPMHHCSQWLKERFPQAEFVEQLSTSTAAQKAASTPHSAAIASRDSAKRYGLKVLEFPIGDGMKNVTQFFVLGRNHVVSPDNTKTSIVFTLPNRPGSLYDILTPFKEEDVNLTRIISRPIEGHPDSYIFLTDVAGTQRQANVKGALDKASKIASMIKNIGSYPVRKAYDS
ncbi:MAG: prephenate dehydratase [Limisphaerales bacterium]